MHALAFEIAWCNQFDFLLLLDESSLNFVSFCSPMPYSP